MSVKIEQQIKKCTNYIRGCRVILANDYTKKKCENCLKKANERDKARRQAIKEQTEKETKEGHKKCTTCFQEYPVEHFIGIRSNETKTCKACRECNKKQDAKRDKEHVNALRRITD